MKYEACMLKSFKTCVQNPNWSYHMFWGFHHRVPPSKNIFYRLVRQTVFPYQLSASFASAGTHSLCFLILLLCFLYVHCILSERAWFVFFFQSCNLTVSQKTPNSGHASSSCLHYVNCNFSGSLISVLINQPNNKLDVKGNLWGGKSRFYLITMKHLDYFLY